MTRVSLPSFVTILLTAAWYFVAVALALTTCLVLASPWLDVRGGEIDIPVSFEVDDRAIRVSAPGIGVSSAVVQQVRGSLRFPPPNRASVTFPLALVALMMAVILWVLGQLIALFRTLRDRRPFDRQNATRIRRIGYAVIAGELARATLIFYSNSYAKWHFMADGLRFDAPPDLNVFALVHGLIILVIAEVFRAGTRLDEDQSLTI
jgi:Protein of unknown function (DUF2975)